MEVPAMYSFFKLFIITICFSAFFINPLSIDAATITVRQDGSGDYTTITDAVAAADPGDTINVGPGTFYEEIWVEKWLNIVSQYGPDSTIIDGEHIRRGIWFHGDIESEIDGFTFQHCNCNNNGSGMRVQYDAFVTARNCVFRNNNAPGVGAGVFAIKPGSHLVIEDCKFISNHASSGTAGMAIEDARLDVINCKFHRNTAEVQSAALQCNYGTMQVTSCIFHHNGSDDLSGGIYYWRSTGFVHNNSFYANSSPGDNLFDPDGATVVVHQSDSVSVSRNIFSNDITGFGMWIFECEITHECNIFWENYQGSIRNDSLGLNEIEADPLFCNPANNYFAIYHDSPAAAPNSPCGQLIGARGPSCGGTVPVAVSFFDAAVTNDKVHLTWEIAGVDELLGFKLHRITLPNGYMEVLNSGMILPNTLRSFEDNTTEAGKTYEYRLGLLLSDQSEMFSAPVSVTMRNYGFALKQNIPNPFNPATTIPYSIPEAGHVLLQVFDVNGKLIDTLVDENKPVGSHTAVWDATSRNGLPAASGVYFVRLKSGNKMSTRKMMLLK
jgi:hypothetical protein